MLLAFAIAALALSLGSGCTDGVTPDCSDAAVCAPAEGSFPYDASTDARDGSSDSGRPPTDAGGDASQDAADGG